MTRSKLINEIPNERFTHEPSELARRRMLSRRGEPLFVAAWRRVLMIHLEVDVGALQRAVPFKLDLFDGLAFVSLVSFTMEGLRPRIGGRWAAMLFMPIATHDFLNVRTYVHHEGESGIHFLAEWLSNQLAVKLGPQTFGLPYRFGKIDYELQPDQKILQGRVTDVQTGTELSYEGSLCRPQQFQPSEKDSLTKWLMERYTAFNAATVRKKFFRAWHPPWPQCEAVIVLNDISLLTRIWPWFANAELVGANYSPGFDAVWMGRPHRILPN